MHAPPVPPLNRMAPHSTAQHSTALRCASLLSPRHGAFAFAFATVRYRPVTSWDSNSMGIAMVIGTVRYGDLVGTVAAHQSVDRDDDSNHQIQIWSAGNLNEIVIVNLENVNAAGVYILPVVLCIAGHRLGQDAGWCAATTRNSLEGLASCYR
eukprot:COSAG02_NODE_68_length_42582_cov_52.351129_43_plen_153_part_00